MSTAVTAPTSMTTSDPVIVFYKSLTCGPCAALSAVWNNPPKAGGDSVCTSFRRIYPNIRIIEVACKDMNGEFDVNAYPKDLRRFAVWFPMIILIPGPSWDKAMSKLGPRNDVTLDGAQPMNELYDETGRMIPGNKYNTSITTEFGRWLKDALEMDSFKKIQNGTSSSMSSSGINIPTTIGPKTPIKPLITKIVKPDNAASDYSPTVNANCSLRIISRPK